MKVHLKAIAVTFLILALILVLYTFFLRKESETKSVKVVDANLLIIPPVPYKTLLGKQILAAGFPNKIIIFN